MQGWVVHGYKDLLTRDVGVSDEEATDIGLRESLRIMRMREVSHYNVDVEIRKMFKDELAGLSILRVRQQRK
jgi:hypothetical protein